MFGPNTWLSSPTSPPTVEAIQSKVLNSLNNLFHERHVTNVVGHSSPCTKQIHNSNNKLLNNHLKFVSVF